MMFVYKGRIYRKAKGRCSDCAFWDDIVMCTYAPICDKGRYIELFISRLAHAIVEVLFTRKEYDK